MPTSAPMPGRHAAPTRAAAFLDRDGVLNIDTGYVIDTATARLTSGAVEAVRALNDAGYLVIVISNQSGVARGLFDEDAVRRFNAWLAAELAKQGARIDAIYYCPHHPTVGEPPYRMDCDCRKPKPGLLLQAAADWPIDLGRSFLIGDRDSDMAAAAAAGIPGFLFEGGDLADFVCRLVRE